MNILHVINSLDPKDGGPPAVVNRLAAAQAALGHRVGIAAYADPAAAERVRSSMKPIPGMERVELLGITPESGGLGTLRAPRLRAWLAEHLKDWDYLHLQGVWDPILAVTAGAARKAGIPYAVVPHGMLDPWCLTGQGLARRVKKSLALALVFRRMLDGAAFLHVLNADEGRLMQPLGLRAPTVVLPNGVFMQEISPLPPGGSFRSAHPELGQDRYVLFLSRLHFKKGLDFLLDAFAVVLDRHPQVRLVIAGPDDGALGAAREQASRLGIAERVHFTGPLYGPEKLGAFVDCAAFCLPSRQEGFSMAITEALGSRRPVVISDQCHFPEVAEAGAGHVVPCGAEPTARALIDVLSLPADEAAAMGGRGHDLVESRFTWPRIAERCLESYERFRGR